MSQIGNKWIQDHAVDNSKLDNTDVYTMGGVRVNGSVGIGTDTPQDLLDIRATSGQPCFRLGLNDGTYGRTYRLYADSYGLLNLSDTDTINGGVRMTMNPVGYFGINRQYPLDMLHIRTTTEDTAIRLDMDGSRGHTYRLVSDTSGNFSVYDVNAGVKRFFLDPDGHATFASDATIVGGLEVGGTVTIINQNVVNASEMVLDQIYRDRNVLTVIQRAITGIGAPATAIRINNAGTGPTLTTDFGTVGFGTEAPQADLHVYHTAGTVTALVQSDSNHAYLTLRSAGGAESGIVFKEGANGKWLLTKNAANDFNLYNYDRANKDIQVSNSSGYVSIGTGPLPETMLDIRQDFATATYNPMVIISSTSGNFGGTLGQRRLASDPRQGLKISSSAGNLTLHGAATDPSPAIQFQTGTVSNESADTNTHMTITGAGYVGIGATNPVVKFSVEGAGTADEDIVRFNNQGDYASRIWIRNAPRSAYISVAPSTGDTIATGCLPFGLNIGINGSISPIQFWNGSPKSVKMTILESGNVGIGTTDTTRVLTVSSDDPATTLANARTATLSISNRNASANTYAGLVFSHFNDRQMFGFIGTKLTVASTEGASDMIFAVKASSLVQEPTEYMRIQAGGNVGIGTSDPQKTLDVQGAESKIRAKGTIRGQLNLQTTTQDGWQIDVFESSSLVPAGALGFTEVGVLTRVTFLKGGNVGIGSTNPTESLDVQGNVTMSGDLTSRATADPHWDIYAQTAGDGADNKMVRIGGGGDVTDNRGLQYI
jgi:hypothetical protein